VRVIPVGESHRDAVHELQRRLEAEGFRVEVDQRDETLGKRIRDSELEKTPFTIVYGDREADAARAWRSFESLAVRERGGEQSTMSLEELLQRFAEEIATIEA
jgi:threonyl-tRNA synthetase